MSRCEGGEFEKIEIEEGSAVWQQVCDFMDGTWRSEYIGVGLGLGLGIKGLG